jgi:hypothetical protein
VQERALRRSLSGCWRTGSAAVVEVDRKAIADETELDPVLEQRLHPGEYEREASRCRDRLPRDRVRIAREAAVADRESARPIT